MIPLFRQRLAIFLGVVLISLVSPTLAQEPPKPYAAIDRDAVNYAGPGRDAAHDLAGREIKIGLVAPLTGPRRAEGEALVRGAESALADEAAEPLPGSMRGQRLVLVARDENGPWGRAASEVAGLVVDERAIALITSADGAVAHLAEQVANKVGVPVLTFSTDRTTTQINLPWIFRLGPTDVGEARAFATDIYVARRLTRVVLVTEADYDGRMGGEDFQRVAKEFSPEAMPVVINVGAAQDGPTAGGPKGSTLVQEIVGLQPEAVVFWTGPSVASKPVEELLTGLPSVPIYLCRKAAQGRMEDATPETCGHCAEAAGGIWTVSATAPDQPANLTSRPRDTENGTTLQLSSAQAYDAVRIIAAALRQAGPNRARLRDALAETQNYRGASGLISFDHAGNDLASLRLVSVR